MTASPSGGTPALRREDVRTLEGQTAGPVSLPGDESYAEESAAFNLTVTNTPAVVVSATAPGDVAAAVRFATERNLPVGVLATGHQASQPTDGAVLINTRRMNTVTIDTSARVARVAAGVVSAQLVDTAAEHGLAPLNGSALTVGVAGYTLGGGFSPFQGRLRGWAADHVHAIEMVTADGQLRRVTADKDPDLFWAVRGGKDNFGIATALEVSLFDVPRLYGGSLFFPGELAGEVLHAFREWVATVPDEMAAAVSLLREPPLPGIPEFLAGKFVVYVRVAYLGSAEEGERLIEPLRKIGPAIVDTVAEVPYADMAHAMPAEPPFPVPFFDSSVWLRELTGEAADAIVANAGPDSGSPLINVELRHLGGALSRLPEPPNAVAGRTAAFHLFTVGVGGPDAALGLYGNEDKLIDSVRPWEATESAPNYFSVRDARVGRIRGAYDPATFERLTSIKRTWDPENTFRINHNIPPAVLSQAELRRPQTGRRHDPVGRGRKVEPPAHGFVKGSRRLPSTRCSMPLAPGYLATPSPGGRHHQAVYRLLM
ncbi:MAG TPA: FAD-binding oxidoreductase [Trebonia sp.]